MTIFEAIEQGDDRTAIELVQREPALRDQRDERGLLPAMCALYARTRELAEALLPPDPVLTSFEAAAFGRLDRLTEHLDADANLVDAFSTDGFTHLHLACFSGGPAVTKVLCERGAPLEALSRHATIQVRPLGTAVFSGDRESAAILLAAGANANAPGEAGFTPLHGAAQHGDVAFVRLLLGHGADPTSRLPDGRTPEDLSRAGGHDECAALLAAAPAMKPTPVSPASGS